MFVCFFIKALQVKYICREICMNAGGKMNIIWVGIVALTINIPLGKWRNRYKKFTVIWWLLIHASIPLIITLRIWLATPRIYIPLFIALAVLGQFIGTKLHTEKKDTN
jgi:hypothetical protein